MPQFPAEFAVAARDRILYYFAVTLLCPLFVSAMGCGVPIAKEVSSLRDYHASMDYDQMNVSFERLDEIAKNLLKRGMSPKEVTRILGAPEQKAEWTSRIEIWTYLISVSGTWCYIVGFLDGKVEYFGQANPQWMYDDWYHLPGAERLTEILRKEKRGIEKPNREIGATSQ